MLIIVRKSSTKRKGMLWRFRHISVVRFSAGNTAGAMADNHFAEKLGYCGQCQRLFDDPDDHPPQGWPRAHRLYQTGTKRCELGDCDFDSGYCACM